MAEDTGCDDEDGAALEDNTAAEEEGAPADDADPAPADDEDTAAEDEDDAAALVAATDEEDARELPEAGREVEAIPWLVAAAELPADEETPALEAPPALLEEDGPASASPVLDVQARFHRARRQLPRRDRMQTSTPNHPWSMGQNRPAGQLSHPGVHRR